MSIRLSGHPWGHSVMALPMKYGQGFAVGAVGTGGVGGAAGTASGSFLVQRAATHLLYAGPACTVNLESQVQPPSSFAEAGIEAVVMVTSARLAMNTILILASLLQLMVFMTQFLSAP